MSRTELAAHLEHGDLEAALRAAATLLANSDDPGVYCLLAVLKAQLQDFGGAVATLESLAALDERWNDLVHELSICVEGEQKRAERRRDPEIALHRAGLGPPPEFARALLDAMLHHAQDDTEEAADAIARARELTPAVAGHLVLDDETRIEFENITVADDLTGPILEGFGPYGLLDIPFCELSSVTFRDAVTYHDTLWAVAHLQTLDGRELAVRVPAFATGSGVHEDAAVRTGALTVWDTRRGYRLASGQVEFELRDANGGTRRVGIQRLRAIHFEPVVH